MQNKTTAAAAVGITAAAATQFNALCALVNSAENCRPISSAEMDLMQRIRNLTADRINAAAGRVVSSFDYADVLNFGSRVKATRILLKAAAFEMAGCGEFWAYVAFAGKVYSARYAVESGYITPDEFAARDFFTLKTATPNKPYAAFWHMFGNEHYRPAFDSIGRKKGYYKSDTFFCVLLQDYAADSSQVYLKTENAALLDYARANQIFTNSAACLRVSKFGAVSNSAEYVSYYSAYILPAEFEALEVAQPAEGGEFIHISEGYIWDDGSFHLRAEGIVCAPDEAVSSYHSRNPLANVPVRFSRNAPYLVGFEVEKEDERVKCSLTESDFYDALPNFRKERDGSLDCIKGFEFISPPMELSPRNIRAYFEARPIAVAHINAAYSTRCGGHIHLSRRGYTGRQLFEMIAGHLPLLHALFPARADGSNSRYSAAKSAAQLLRDREKYQSINILPDRIEFRIFGAVRGLDNLIWRAGLLLKLFKHAANSPAAGYDKLPALFSHLRKVYTTPAEMEMLIKRVEKYARKFESYRCDFGADSAGVITDAARLKVYRPATARTYSKHVTA